MPLTNIDATLALINKQAIAELHAYGLAMSYDELGEAVKHADRVQRALMNQVLGVDVEEGTYAKQWLDARRGLTESDDDIKNWHARVWGIINDDSRAAEKHAGFFDIPDERVWRRRATGSQTCVMCQALAGDYDADAIEEAGEVGLFKRHKGCDCRISIGHRGTESRVSVNANTTAIDAHNEQKTINRLSALNNLSDEQQLELKRAQERLAEIRRNVVYNTKKK